ncbi:MAG: valine--tRNA ligase [bacterium]|nr:valine--tRNA ligase [bacterium]
MDSKFIPSLIEAELYSFWETKGYFKAEPNTTKTPFTIILPPPNANADLHVGHAMYTYEDVMIRYYKLKGRETLWLPGSDHAGFETQFVFEKYLKKQDKSRFDYDRETLFKMIWDFVQENKGTMQNQLRRLGFALDWSKEKFTMDDDIVKIVYSTFKKMFDEGLVYRAERLVNYCTRDGTSFSDLEVVDQEVEGWLYHIRFPIKEGGEVVVATTRPETYVGDVAVMVNPKDPRYKSVVGKHVILPLIHREIPIIADSYVDMKFGTGAVKVTPAHDFNDFEIARKHNLTHPPVIGFNGRMQNTGIVDGLKVLPAREELLKQLEEKGFLIKKVPHKMVLKTCYKCGSALEPLPLEQWYIKVKPLIDQAMKLVQEGKIQVYPKKYTLHLRRILKNFIDWNISRQIVWGIRIPAYKCVAEDTPRWFVSVEKPKKCQVCGTCTFVQDQDTFDTWFSSAQWPFATLQTLGQAYYDYFYPTTVMETGYDILRAWVARMIMMGYFMTGKAPFHNVFLHGMVRDKHGQKMSKSKGNVVNPIEMIDTYGADALRGSLLFEVKDGSDVSLSDDRLIGMRNFTNKIWNMGRFLDMSNVKTEMLNVKTKEIKKILTQLEKESQSEMKKYHKYMKEYKFSKALGLVYEFIWHRFADVYIERLKDEIRNGNIEVLDRMKEVYFENLKMLHPFMPFVTEAVWQVFKGKNVSILETEFVE